MNQIISKMTSTRRIILIFGSIVALSILTWTAFVYKKPNCSSLLCQEHHSEKGDEETMRQNSTFVMQLSKPTQSKRVKEFVYLIQTEQCLSANYLNEEYFGVAERCRCEVIVLSYKKLCEDKNNTHIEYLSRPPNVKKISWNEGRNLLYSSSRARNYEYLYYIFADDDMKLAYDEGHTPSWMRSVSPMRSFENFLLEYKPAIGVPNLSDHQHSTDAQINAIKALCKGDRYNSSSIFIPVIHFDAILNAFHKDVVEHLLPYPLKYDQSSWHHSQRYIVVATEIKFRGQCSLFIPTLCVNPKHRGYPRGQGNNVQVWSLFVKDLLSISPPEYTKEKWMQEFVKDPEKHLGTSQANCWKFPIGYPKQPFAYFALNQEFKN